MKLLLKNFLLLLFSGTACSAQSNYGDALNAWQNGNLPQSRRLLAGSPVSDSAGYLKMKLDFAEGGYQQALKDYAAIKPAYANYKDAADLAVEAQLHLHDYKGAAKTGAAAGDYKTAYYAEMAAHPLKVIADRTYKVPFINDGQQLNDFMPGVNGSVNGIQVQIRFDTGGSFLVIGKKAAEKLGITYSYEDKQGLHAAKVVSRWFGIASRMTFDNGPAFENVPVVVLADLGDNIIFGTNILEQFLSTVDYPGKQFILTPRGNAALYRLHLEMLKPEMTKVPFYLWSDHYMFARGKFAGRDSLNLFFDSGLVAVTLIDGKVMQAPFTASRASLIRWGLDSTKMDKSGFFPTAYILGVANLGRPNTLVYYDVNLPKDRIFGGVRMDGLISHAWLKNYQWTLDFDKRQYLFTE